MDKIIANNLDILAKHGIIAAVDGRQYQGLRVDQGVQYARRLLKRYTSHNEKLGFDFSAKVGERGYVYDYTGELFKKSAYVEFLKAAQVFHKDSRDLVNHFSQTLARYKIDNNRRDEILREQGQSLSAIRPYGDDDPRISGLREQGYIDQIQEISSENERLKKVQK